MKSLICPCTGVNIPRFLTIVIAGLIFVLGEGYLVHHILLSDIYKQTADLWRSPEQMKDFFSVMLGAQFLFTLISALIYTRHHEGKGTKEGLRFGLLLGLLLAVVYATPYAYMPIPLGLALYWALDGLVIGLGLGLIFSLLYKGA